MIYRSRADGAATRRAVEFIERHNCEYDSHQPSLVLLRHPHHRPRARAESGQLSRAEPVEGRPPRSREGEERAYRSLEIHRTGSHEFP
jgi:hypothetical protein